jgi:hypothetical protein
MEWSRLVKPMHPKGSGGGADGRAMSYVDRRAEERHDAEGEVSLVFEEPLHQEITGTLADYSKSGFRAVHSCADLHSGQLVYFRHFIASGTARVMWNRIQQGRVESGFLVITVPTTAA